MNRAKLNYWVDVGLLISFILCFFTGIMKIPAFALHRFIQMRVYTIIHDFSGVIIGLLVFVHLILHWRWLVVMTKKVFKNEKNNIN